MQRLSLNNRFACIWVAANQNPFSIAQEQLEVVTKAISNTSRSDTPVEGRQARSVSSEFNRIKADAKQEENTRGEAFLFPLREEQPGRLMR